MARMRDLSRSEGEKFLSALAAVPDKVRETLLQRDRVQAIAKKYFHCDDFLFLAAGSSIRSPSREP
jgi:glucosamine--fructose-6-phosphate aminotransferase (isomerizing)